MGFSNEWEEAYKRNEQMSIWPWTDLIIYVMRYIRPKSPDFRVLELGCGAGANIPFFLSLEVEYYAVEGSPTIVEQLKESFPKIKNNIKCADFSKSIPFEGKFDLIVDRSSLTMNSTIAIKKTIKKIKDLLKKGGKFIGIDWYSTDFSEYKKGEFLPNDNYSKHNFKEGSFKGLGVAHFSDKKHILELFKDFTIEFLEHNITKREIPDDGYLLAKWNFIAKKT